jgi:ferric-dicitrate binding protein FerR (iron transport regulator)
MSEEPRRPTDERDDVAALVRLAGKRQAVPGERAECVRAAARDEWRRGLRRRARRRYAWAAAGLAAAAALVLAVALRVVPSPAGQPRSADVARVESLTGPAWSGGDGPTRRPLAVGDELALGSELSTDATARVAIRLASGHSVRLDASTRLHLLERGALGLDRGALYVDSGLEGAAAGPLDVRTPLGVIHEVGTQFEVRLEGDALRVRLREGAVVVQRDAREHEARVGTELELGRDGSVVRRTIAPHGPAWEWIVGVTPMLDLEGRSARAFLDWVARERGWRLAFADDSVARSAAQIVLGGTVERLTLDEALDAVLPTCRLTYRIDRGVLVVAAAR